jgi:hypothetical protein
VRILVVAVLLVVMGEDFKSRSVHLVLFPALAMLFFLTRLSSGVPLGQIIPDTSINLGFVILQLLLLTVYFSIKRREFVLITDGLIGWGDVLLLCCAATFFPVFSFVLFYIGSLVFVLLTWLVFMVIAQSQNRKIPMAGLQALALLIVLIMQWCLHVIDLTDDSQFLHFST